MKTSEKLLEAKNIVFYYSYSIYGVFLYTLSAIEKHAKKEHENINVINRYVNYDRNDSKKLKLNNSGLNNR